MLPDDEEEVPLRGRRRKDKELGGKALEVQVLRSTVTPGTMIERSTDPAQTNVTFAVPLSTDCPSGSAAQTSAAMIQLSAPDPAAASIALPSSNSGQSTGCCQVSSSLVESCDGANESGA